MKVYWRQGILYPLIIAIEGCWLYAVASLLNTLVADGKLAVPGIMVLFPVSVAFNMLLHRIKWHMFFLRAISWFTWTIAVLLTVKVYLFVDSPWFDTGWLRAIPNAITVVIYTFKPELLIAIIGALLWQLGRRLAQTRITFAVSVGEFQFGLVILLILFFVTTTLGIDLAGSVPIAISFFVLSLLGMSLAHAFEGTSWLSGLYRERWVGLLVISIVMVLLIGAFVSLVVNRDLIQVALNVLNWIWELTVMIIIFLISLLPQSEPPELPPEPTTPGTGGGEEGFQLFTMPEWLRDTLRLGWGMLMLSIFVLALWRLSTQIFLWLHRRLSGTGGTEFESLPGALKADILRIIRGILWLITFPFRLRRSARPFIPEISPVRQVYRELLRWTTRRGFPRAVSQTPQEYLSALAGVIPGACEDLRLITQQYIAARYGAQLVADDELCQLKESWHRVKRNRLKKTGA